MKRLVLLIGLLIVFIVAFGNYIEVSAFVEFQDDFQTGLNPAVWNTEVINGGSWEHAVEGSNGYIVATTSAWGSWDNRNLDISTNQHDFDDFVFSWDMRLDNQGMCADYRNIYFRSDNSPNPYGYYVNLRSWDTTPSPNNSIAIMNHKLDGSEEQLALVYPGGFGYEDIDPWALNQWYSFKLQVIGNEFKLKYWKKGDAELSSWVIKTMDSASMYSSGSVGFGNYVSAQTGVDNVSVTGFGGGAPVPEPASMLMFGTGLLGMIGFGRKKYFKL